METKTAIIEELIAQSRDGAISFDTVYDIADEFGIYDPMAVDKLFSQIEKQGIKIIDEFLQEITEEKVMTLLEKRRNLPFPTNLQTALHIENIQKWQDEIAILKLLGNLPQREDKLLLYRYRDKFSLEEIAEIYHLTRERIRQIEKKAMAKLKRVVTVEDNNAIETLWLTNRTYNHLKNSGAKTIDDVVLMYKQRRLSRLYGFGEKAYNEIEEKLRENNYITENDDPTNMFFEKTLETALDMMGLSGRAYNALLKIDCSTLGDVVSVYKKDRLVNISGVGRKTYEEIEFMLYDSGYILDEEVEIADISQILNKNLDGFGFSVRSYNALRRAGCNIIDDVIRLYQRNELLGTNNIGKNSYDEIVRILHTNGCLMVKNASENETLEVREQNNDLSKNNEIEKPKKKLFGWL